MTEDDYINTMNLARIRMIMHLLRDLTIHGPVESEARVKALMWADGVHDQLLERQEILG